MRDTPLVGYPMFKAGDHVSVTEQNATGLDVCQRQGIVTGTSLVNFESHKSWMYSVLIPGERNLNDYFEWQLKPTESTRKMEENHAVN